MGGTHPGSANVISGNQFVGIWLEGGPDICRFYTIKGNYIGTDYLGLNPLGNLDDGIYFGQVAQSNFVGPDNIIAFNGGDGVQVDTPTATGNLITLNRIFANGGLGIHLTNGGNSAIPAPAIQSTTFGSIDSIRIAVSACGGCAVQVFNSRFPEGEGEFYLGGGRGRRRRELCFGGERPPLPLPDGHRHRCPGHFGIFGGLHLHRLSPCTCP